MIARVRTGDGQSGYVALYLNSRGHTWRVRVPILRGEATKGGCCPLMALLLCVLTLQTSMRVLVADVCKLCGLADKHSSTDEHRQLRMAARYIANMLERSGMDLLRLIEQPTVDDIGAPDVEYNTGPGIIEDELLITRHQLRAGRVIAGLGVRDLAERAGISPTAVSQIETGKTRTPHAKTMMSLASALCDVGVEFVHGGWVRHRDDADREHDPFDTDCMQ